MALTTEEALRLDLFGQIKATRIDEQQATDPDQLDQLTRHELDLWDALANAQSL